MAAREQSLHRILVVVDASPAGLAALETAAALAARRSAQLETLFVEDVNLFHLAELPFARELDRTSGRDRPMSEPQVAQTLNLFAQRVRRVLDTATQNLKIRYSLRIVRGHYVAEAIEASSGADVLLLGCIRGLRYPRRTPASRRAVWTLYDGSEAASRALELARDACRADHLPLNVLIPAPQPAQASTLSAQARQIVGDEVTVRLFDVASADIDGIRDAVKSRDCGLLVLPQGNSLRTPAAAEALLEVLNGPLVLVA